MVRDVKREQLDQRIVHSLNLAIALRVVGDVRVFLMFINANSSLKLCDMKMAPWSVWNMNGTTKREMNS